MKKVILGMNVSLDGYVATADKKLDWAFVNFDNELFESAIDALSQLDTVLIGRMIFRPLQPLLRQSLEDCIPFQCPYQNGMLVELPGHLAIDVVIKISQGDDAQAVEIGISF